MLEVMLAIFSQVYLPLVLPGIGHATGQLNLLDGLIFTGNLRLANCWIKKTVSLDDIQELIEQREFKNCLVHA